jgi:hypothetical protein
MSDETKQNPEIQDPTDFIYYVTREGIKYDYSRRDPKNLVHDVNVAHDFIRKLIREKDALRGTIERQKLWIKVLGAATAGVWGIVLVLVGLLFEYR